MDVIPPRPGANRQVSTREQLSALDFISTLLAEDEFDLDHLLDVIARVAAQTLQMKAATIRLLDKETGEMVLKAAYGLSQRYLSKGPVIATKSAFRQMIEQCGERGEVVEIFDMSQDPRVYYPKEALAEGIYSLLAAPLPKNNRVHGALSVFTAQPHHFTDNERQALKTLANQASVAIALAESYEERLTLEHIAHELSIAAAIQRQLMPSRAPQISGCEIAGYNRASKEVGGDFYDYIELPNANLGIAIGDVSGKGIPAALLMATVRTALRVQAENIYAMREIVGRVNRALHLDTQAEEFATLFYAVLNVQQRVLTYVNAGHLNPHLFRSDEVFSLETGNPPLGILPTWTYQEDTIGLQPGDLLIFFTDGYTEAPNEDDELFGEERLLHVIGEHRHLDAEDLVRTLDETVTDFTDEAAGYSDDRTIIVLKVQE